MKRMLAVILAALMLLSTATFVLAEDFPYDKLEFYAQSTPYTTPSQNKLEGVTSEEEFIDRINEIAAVSAHYYNEETVYVTVNFSFTYSSKDHLASHGYSDYSRPAPQDVRCYGYCRADYYSDLLKDFKFPEDIKASDYTENIYSPSASVSFKIKKEDISLSQIKELISDNAVSGITFSSIEYKEEFIVNSPEFADVNKSAWYCEHVNNACSMGLMEGTTATTFEPNAALTRAMLVTMIGRFDERLNGTLGEAGENPFSDVKAGKWYTDYVIWAAEIGIVEGYPDGTFRPDKEVTREEAVTILGRYYKLNAPETVYTCTILVTYFPHTDTAEIADWAQKWVYEGMRIGAIHYEKANYGDTMADAPEYYFEPGRSMTRAEAAKVAYIFLNDLRLSIEKGYCARSCDLDAVK